MHISLHSSTLGDTLVVLVNAMPCSQFLTHKGVICCDYVSYQDNSPIEILRGKSVEVNPHKKPESGHTKHPENGISHCEPSSPEKI